MNMLAYLNWSVVGLIYDIAGAIALAAAIFLNSPAKIAHLAGTYWDSSSPAIHALAEQTVDARLGLVLLVFGFVFQVFGQWWNEAYAPWHLVTFAGLILIVGVFLSFRNVMVKRIEAQAEDREEQ